MTAADTMTWCSQQQTADSAAALAAAAGMGWPVQQYQQQTALERPDDVVRGMLWGGATEQQSVQRKVQRSTSFSSAQAGVAGASPALSNSSHGTAAAFAAAMQSAQQQTAPCSTGSMLSPHGMLSPAAYVHNAQQMLLQQSQQMQAMQQQQVLLSLASQQQQVQQAHHHRTHKHAAPIRAGAGVAIPSTGAASATAQDVAVQGKIRSPAQRLQHQQHDEGSTPCAMRAALGDRTFFSIRSLMLKQQEAFVAQLYELHRLTRVQEITQAEVSQEHYSLTKQYEQSALDSLQLLQAKQQQHSSRCGKTASGTVRADSKARSSTAAAARAHQQLQQQRLLAGARPVATDDRGASAVASLPVHAVLLANLPSTMRAAVSQPAVDYATVNPKTYYVKQAHAPGVVRPTPMRFVGRSHGKGGSDDDAAAAAAKPAGPAVSGEDTVQVDERMGPPAVQSDRQQQRRGSSSSSLQARRRQTAAAAAAPTSGKGKPPLSGTPRNNVQQQQQQDMPPPRPMLPEQAAQHAAAAAAQYQHKLQQQQQEAAAAAVMDAAAAGLQAAAGLNVFRPMPQINPQFASKFLAGGQSTTAAAAAQSAPRFDPHAYWMSKHYGGAQEHNPTHQAGQDAAAAAAVAAVASGLMGGAMNAAAVGADMMMGDAASTAAAARMPGGRSSFGAASSKQQQQLTMAAASGLAGLAAAAAASAGASAGSGAVDPAAAAAAPRPVVHWWQDAEATFGEVGLVDPNARGFSSMLEGTSHGARDGAKRDFPQQYSLQQLPHKKRVKLAAAGGGNGYGSYEAGSYHSYGAPRHMGDDAGEWEAAQHGAFKPMERPALTKERSRVRSNHMGSSRQCESSVCSDNSASSIDNPSYMAAAAAAAAAGELGPDADGVSLLLHMGQQKAQQQYGARAAGGGAGRGRGGGGRGSATGGAERSSSYAASGVGGGSGAHSTAKSAAGILLSLSASQGDAF